MIKTNFKTVRRWTSVFLLLCLMMGILSVFSEATSDTASGTCGDNLTWTLDDSGNLTVSGTGEMYGYLDENAPWDDYSSDIRKVIIGKGVTSIGDYAFYYCTEIENVELSNSIKEIGEGAFEMCYALESLQIPDSVEKNWKICIF